MGSDIAVEKAVDVLISDSVRVTGYPTGSKLGVGETIQKDMSVPTTQLVQSIKRKGSSSPLKTAHLIPYISAGARKLQRGDPGEVGSSPALKIRRGLNTQPKSPPAGGVLTSPAVGRIGKTKRCLKTPRRTYTPDRKQALITSLFSPKVLSTTDNTKE